MLLHSRVAIQKTAIPGEASGERAIASVINKSWPVLSSDASTQLAHLMIAANNAGGVIGNDAWESWIRSLGGVVKPMQAQIAKSVLEAGLTSGIAHLGFENVDAVSVKYAQTQGGKLIKNLQDSQRATVNMVMGRALQGEMTVDQAARSIRSTIGLHPAWAQAVINRRESQYQQLLKEGMHPTKASALADKRAQTYSDRLVRTRAMNVARTEIQTAQNLGRYATWSQMIGYGYLSAKSNKEWSPGPGACPICSAMAGETVQWDQPFSVGAMMPPAHVNCRCSAVLLPVNTGQAGLDPRPINWLNPTGYVTPPSEADIGLDGGGFSAADIGATALTVDDGFELSQPGSQDDSTPDEAVATDNAPVPTPLKGVSNITERRKMSYEIAQKNAEVVERAHVDIGKAAMEAVRKYQGSSYRYMNQLLRGTLSPNEPQEYVEEYKKWVGQVNGSFDKQQPLSSPINVWRGMNSSHVDPATLKVGDVVRDKAFISTALDEQDAMGFMSFSKNTFIFEIHVPAGTKVMSVNLASGRYGSVLQYESEILMRPGTKLKITGTRKELISSEVRTVMEAEVIP